MVARESLWERKRRVRERKGGAFDEDADMHADESTADAASGVRTLQVGLYSASCHTPVAVLFSMVFACSPFLGSCVVFGSVVNTLRNLRQPPD